MLLRLSHILKKKGENSTKMTQEKKKLSFV